MRPYILAETNWKALKDEAISLAVLPWGATEAHNYHLPYGTDVFEADAIGAAAGKIAWQAGEKVMILPTIPFGVNTGQADIYLDINLNPSTQLAILKDIVAVLHRQGIPKLLILNSHGGNDFKVMLREIGLLYPDMFFCTCNWFQAMDKPLYFEEMGDHADEMETSLIQYLHPKLVLPLEEAGEGREKKSKVSGIREGWAWSERKWSLVSEDTGIGNPKLANAEKGRRFLQDVSQKVAELFIEISRLDINNRYE
ncbi:Creatinine amidohydrolase [Lunatimonas lonarensis]|uniref:Creatinine amidohydrolase n=1 Tax=Lunatimonas lonarensis TaxID=1232681 RepID=R7ZZ50_9BACT|nr:creatininase family protein [Lunatimonas lonarensis]EON79371.1 Creatinine amidohydrolase [Lunatimonas lonarensis]